jgi:Family of unknown function (DUF6054)
VAKHECALRRDFDTVLRALDTAIIQGSSSAKLEDASDLQLGGVRCAVRVYERYSLAGGNRVSLSLTLLGDGEHVFVSAITSGGSQAVFFKVNTMGEESFLRYAVDALERLAIEETHR